METRWRTKKLRLIVGSVAVCLLLVSIYGGIRGWFAVGKDESGRAVVQELGLKKDQARENNLKLIDSVVKRKNIFDRSLNELAVSLMVSSVYVKPLELNGNEEAVAKLAEILGLDEKELSTSLATERGFVWLARNIDLDSAGKLHENNFAGVYLVKEAVRFYPHGSSASHIIGFSKEGQGLTGVESFYDNFLSGSVGSDAANLAAAGIAYSEPLNQDGTSLVLSVDLQIQSYLEKKLSEQIKKMQARSGLALIMVPETGEVLALVNSPSYDVNMFWKYDSFERRNRILTEPVTVGGILNIFRMAAEFERGNIPEFIKNQEEIAAKIIEPRYLKKIVSKRMRKVLSHQWKKLTDGIYWSAPEKIFDFVVPKSDLDDFTKEYGLIGECNVDLPCPGKSDTGNVISENFSLTDLKSSTTAMHLLTAFCRLINGGVPINPHVLKELWLEDQDQKIITSFGGGEKTASKDLSNNFLRLLNQLSPRAAGRGIFVETLVAEEDDGSDANLEFSSDTSEIKQDVLQEEKQDNRLFQDIMLAAAPFHAPEIALVMVIDGAVIDLSRQSETRSVVEKIIARALKIHRSEDKFSPTQRLQDKEIYARWSKIKNRSDRREVSIKNQSRSMPSVKNLSIRKALQILQNYNLRIKVVGSGRVISQHPPPGTLITDIRDCTLELRADE